MSNKRRLALGARLAALLVFVAATPIPVPPGRISEPCPFAEQRVHREQVIESVPGKVAVRWKFRRRPELTLCKADLSGVDLSDTNLIGTNLREARLAGARLIEANLTRADLTGADLTGAVLFGARLTKATLREANLTSADLRFAFLNEADLKGAILDGTWLSGTDLSAVNFEPELGYLSSARGIESAKGLASLTFTSNPAALVVLRKQFIERGLREQERQVTFAKLRVQQTQTWRGATWMIEYGPTPDRVSVATYGTSFWQKMEAMLSYVAFDMTSSYGLHYGRPLKILGSSILLLGFVYALALRSRGMGAVWRVWFADRIQTDEGRGQPERLYWESWPGGPPRPWPFQALRAFGFGLLFSLLSAFHIGWRDLNVGNWISRLLPKEYTLRGTGWVRVVAGV